MDWIIRLQNVINYIENHLTDDIDYNKVAQEAYCSSFYLQKVFSILFGMTIGDYIRNRRLTLAGNELSVSANKVIDVALKYRYESPESFTRAFLKFHGITPSEAKKDGSKLKFFYPLSVKVTLSGGNIMDYKVVVKDEFDIIEKSEPQSKEEAKSIVSIQEFWKKSFVDGTVKKLFDISEEKDYIIGICYGNLAKKDSDTFNYSVAAKCKKDTPVPEGFRKSTIPARTWAVFECRGPIPDAMQDMWRMIISEFFPSSEYRPTYEMDIEIYPEGDRKSTDYRSEIWVPIEKISNREKSVELWQK